MSATVAVPKDSMVHIEWMWQSNPDPWSKSEPAEWSYYSDIENLIIEEAFSAERPHAKLDDYYIDFKHSTQISYYDDTKQRAVQRIIGKKEINHLRQERFMPNPIAPKRPFGGQYGWISPFILEVRKNLNVTATAELPSRNKASVPEIVEKATVGITEEGTSIGRRLEAEKMAEILMGQRYNGIENVWRCCAQLYTMESFLYRRLNAAMRLIGDDENEHVWRNAVRTLGPFCLLLWDNPLNTAPNTDRTLYRGAMLSDDDIATYKELAKHPVECRSFQAFTSCSRNRAVAELYGNALFIVEVIVAFTTDISPWSKHFDEEEELVYPGVCFNVRHVEFDEIARKYLVYLRLRQRHSENDKHQIIQTTAAGLDDLADTDSELTDIINARISARRGRRYSITPVDAADIRAHFGIHSIESFDYTLRCYDRDGNIKRKSDESICTQVEKSLEDYIRSYET